MTRRKVAGLTIALTVLGALLLVLIVFFGPYGTFVWQVWGSEVPINFYGKIVDSSGTGVPDAEVTVQYNIPDRAIDLPRMNGSNYTSRTIKIRTDSAGAFSVTNTKGISLYVLQVSHPSYVSIPEPDWLFRGYKQQMAFTYVTTSGNTVYVPDNLNPAVFTLRRPDEKGSMPPLRGGHEKKIP